MHVEYHRLTADLQTLRNCSYIFTLTALISCILVVKAWSHLHYLHYPELRHVTDVAEYTCLFYRYTLLNRIDVMFFVF